MAEQQDIGHEEAGPSGRRSAPRYRAQHFPRAQSPNPQRSNSPNSPHSAQNSLPNSPNQPPSPQYLLRLMPYRTDRNAPKFDGKARSLPRFFEDIEVLARDCGVTEPELIAQTLRYLDGSDYDTWRSRPTASGNNWEDFKQEIMSMYPGAEDDSLYSITDLEIFVERHASSPLRDRVQFGSYYRDFLTRSDWLFDQGLISNRERNKFFMNGFHIDFRNQLRMQLRLQDPFHALDEPWEVETVAQAVLFLLDSPNSRNLLTFSSPPQVPHNSPPVNLPSPPNTSNHVSRPTFDMSSIEHILMSDAFINRLASRILIGLVACAQAQSTCFVTVQPWMIIFIVVCANGTRPIAFVFLMESRLHNSSHPQVQSNILEVSISPSQGTTIPLSASSLTCSEPTTSYDEEIARLDAIALAAASAECTNPDTSTTPKTNTTKSSTSITPQSSTTAPAPQYRFASPIEDSGTIQSVIKRSLDGTVTLTQKELYAGTKWTVYKGFFNRGSTRRSPNDIPCSCIS